MNFCACGNQIPEGFDVCELCEAFGDDDPLPSDEYTAEDKRIDAMDDDSDDGDMGYTYWEKDAA